MPVGTELRAGRGGPSAGRSGPSTATDRRPCGRGALGWRRALVVLGFGVAAVVGIGLSADVAAGPPILAGRWGILARMAVWSVAWVLGVVCALRLPPRVAVAAVVVVAAGLRLAALAGHPPLSDDLFRYSWDGRVQQAGIDPYRHPPEDPALAGLREGWLWPDAAGCAELDRPPGCTRINRPMVHTIYPPLAEAWFAVVHRLGGIESRHKSWQAAGAVTDLVLVGLLVAALRRRGRDPRWVALYALAPFPVVEVVANGHVDGLAALLLVAALAAVAPRRGIEPVARAGPLGWPGGAGRMGWVGRAGRATDRVAGGRVTVAGALVGAATLVKLYPALALVGLVGAGVGAGARGGRRPSRLVTSAWAGLGFAVVVVAGYLPHVVAVGSRVLGYLPGYLQEERYDQGTRFLLVGLVAPSPAPARAGALLALGAVIAWVLHRRPEPAAAVTVLLGSLLLIATPVQPWYAVSLLAVATLAGRPAWAAVAAAGYPYFFAVILDHPHAVAIGRWGYGLALLVVAAVAARRLRAGRPAVAAGGRPPMNARPPRQLSAGSARNGGLRRQLNGRAGGAGA